MTGITDPFFGGAERKAAKAERVELRKSQELLRQGKERAEDSTRELFPQARDSLRGGFQGALDVFGQALPQQAQAFQGGNLQAQQTLINSLPQIQNAILGGPVNFGGFQPAQQHLPDFGFAQQNLAPQINSTVPVNNPLVRTRPTKFNDFEFGRFGSSGRGRR